jgi:hypothetical protein
MMTRKRDTLIEAVKSELKKDAAAIDPGFLDRRIDELYALDGLAPPKLEEKQLLAAARTVRARAAWRRQNRAAKQALKRRFTARAVPWAAAACCAVLLLFSANYVSTLLTGSCLPSKAGIKICCGTKICLCDTGKREETAHPE